MLFNLKEIVESLASTIKQFEVECANTTKRIREKIVSQVFMSNNMPKVVESILNGEYSDADLLKAECAKLVDSVHYSEKKGLIIDIQPEKAIQAFSQTEQEVVKSLHKAAKSFTDAVKKLEKSFEVTAAVIDSSIVNNYTF